MSTFAQNSVFLSLESDAINGFKWNLHVSIDHGSTISCQIWPGLVKKDRHKSPHKLWTFGWNCLRFLVYVGSLWYSDQITLVGKVFYWWQFWCFRECTLWWSLGTELEDVILSVVQTEQYSEFLEANRLENSDDRYLKLRELLDALPDCNYYTLGVLMQHLHRVASHHDENKVTNCKLIQVYMKDGY